MELKLVEQRSRVADVIWRHERDRCGPFQRGGPPDGAHLDRPPFLRDAWRLFSTRRPAAVKGSLCPPTGFP